MKMNVLVTIDSNYIKVLIKMLRTLVAANSEEFDVYVAHSSLSPYDLGCIKNGVQCERINIIPIQISSQLFEGAYFSKRISKETYYRLLLFKYLPLNVSKVLYLDPDIAVINSVRSFYDIEFGDNIIAGAGHTSGLIKEFNRMRLNLRRNGDYINAGVLMISVDNMRKYITAEQIFNLISQKGRTLFQADQDVINALFKDKIISIDPCYYNLDETTYRKKGLNLEWVKHNTVFIHYNGKNKPWNSHYKGELNVFWNGDKIVVPRVQKYEAAV